MAVMSAEPIPTAHLLIERSVINPPKPLGIAVEVDGKIIATVSLEHFKEVAARLAAQLDALKSARGP